MKARTKIAGTLLSLVVLTIAWCNHTSAFSYKHPVGSRYEVVGELYVVGNMIKVPLDYDREKMRKKETRLPLGTVIEVLSVREQTNSSWNTGTYTFSILHVAIKKKEYEGYRFDASQLAVESCFGNDGSNGLAVLKPIAGKSAK